MHQTAGETARFVSELGPETGASAQRFVIPPFTSLGAVVDLAHAANIWVGAQNVHAAPSGEFTGEISARMLSALNVDLVLVGHAERRRLFGEDDATVRDKVEAALTNELRVLLCVGDSADERRCGAAVDAVLRQVRLALGSVPDRSRVIVAYEPVWAIGANAVAAAPEDVTAVTAALGEWLGSTPLLYGGSVTAATAAAYARLPGVDGLFVGRAAWTAEGFIRVLQAAAL